MIQCEYCTRGFIETTNGLAEKTFHELLHEPEVVNKWLFTFFILYPNFLFLVLNSSYMVAKTSKKKVTKTVKRQPTPAAVLKKVSSVSDSNKALQKEIKVMSKIFGENQKVLVSMKGMIDTLTSTLEHIQKQSKQINIIEEDTQKLYAGLNQVRTQSNLIY